MQNKTKQDIEDLQQIVSDNSSAIGQNKEKIDKTGWAVQGSEKIIPNALFIGGDYNTGKWGCVSTQTVGLPPIVEVRISETISYDNNNATIRLTENRPVKGRIWTNTYDGATWSGWKALPTTDVSLVPKTTTATKLGSITEAGIYYIYNCGNGTTAYTDYPAFLKSKGFTYGLLTVSINTNYIKYDLTVVDSAIIESITISGFRVSENANITWGNKEYIQTVFLNGWTTYNPVILKKESVNKVSIKGLIQQGLSDANTQLFTIPTEFRPARAQYLASYTGNGSTTFVPQALLITSSGDVSLTYTNAQNFIFIDVEYNLD